MSGFFCVHGHFYQPPREDPWYDVIAPQESAAPFLHWNQRILAECYAPNAETQVIQNDLIETIINNYSLMSFNFGPTLLDWLEKNAPETYAAILLADQESQRRFNGHGSAIAQTYHHIIMPLASARDQKTEVIWGIEDFRHRFKRNPEGMWLPETAVNNDVLEILAEQGIRFTILAPDQAAKIRSVGEKSWQSVSANSLDVTQSYLCRLPSGRDINIFFYDGQFAHDLAFGQALKDGEALYASLESRLNDCKSSNALFHAATDGETFGHHHKFGNMGLAYVFWRFLNNNKSQLTIYAEHLDRFPPRYEVCIQENTAWSCSHGIERWRSDCGCCIDSNSGFHQKWRGPLREALECAKAQCDDVYEETLKPISDQPWSVRDAYIHHIKDDFDLMKSQFFKKYLGKVKDDTQQRNILLALEMQRQVQMMFTSCGWFFDDLGNIETVQNLRYAARALELYEALSGRSHMDEMLKSLSSVEGNAQHSKRGDKLFKNMMSLESRSPDFLMLEFAIARSLRLPVYQKKWYGYVIESYSESLTEDVPVRSEKQNKNEVLMPAQMDLSSFFQPLKVAFSSYSYRLQTRRFYQIHVKAFYESGFALEYYSSETELSSEDSKSLNIHWDYVHKDIRRQIFQKILSHQQYRLQELLTQTGQLHQMFMANVINGLGQQPFMELVKVFISHQKIMDALREPNIFPEKLYLQCPVLDEGLPTFIKEQWTESLEQLVVQKMTIWQMNLSDQQTLTWLVAAVQVIQHYGYDVNWLLLQKLFFRSVRKMNLESYHQQMAKKEFSQQWWRLYRQLGQMFGVKVI